MEPSQKVKVPSSHPTMNRLTHKGHGLSRRLQNKRINSRYLRKEETSYINEVLASAIDLDKVINESEMLKVDQYGRIILDRNNPSHREWMED